LIVILISGVGDRVNLNAGALLHFFIFLFGLIQVADASQVRDLRLNHRQQAFGQHRERRIASFTGAVIHGLEGRQGVLSFLVQDPTDLLSLSFFKILLIGNKGVDLFHNSQAFSKDITVESEVIKLAFNDLHLRFIGLACLQGIIFLHLLMHAPFLIIVELSFGC